MHVLPAFAKNQLTKDIEDFFMDLLAICSSEDCPIHLCIY
jgi:hypothetical protein